jgi:hypothetical protein
MRRAGKLGRHGDRLSRSDDIESTRRQRHRYTVTGGMPARVSPGGRRSPHTWLVRKEMRESEERILMHAEEIARARARETEERVRERMEEELADLRPLVEGGLLLREELKLLRATNEDLRSSLMMMTMSLREELASTSVDC